MARGAVRQAARSHAGVRRDPARHLGAGAAPRAPGPALPDSLPRPRRLGPRQAPQEHRARPADPDLPGGHRTEERRTVRGDSGRLAADLLLAIPRTEDLPPAP